MESVLNIYICTLVLTKRPKLKTKVLLVLAAGILFTSCAGLRKKDQPEYDMMDNLTSRFNIIYHAKEIIADAEQENGQSFKANYYDLLPIFIEPDEASTARHTALMDSVLGKAKRVIDDKEKSRFTDDAYFLMGRANYLKGNYHQAAAFFAYVANTYPEARKQRQLAWTWQIRSLMQSGALNETAPVWDSVFTHLDEHKRTRAQAYATRASYYLKLGEEREAISFLSQALKLRSDREQKLRWHFLIAQLLERQGENAQAAKHYQKVARSNASYEMAFQAALNRTFLLASEGMGGDASLIRPLQRMLRDDKNKSFKDQIHYYIAESYVRQGEMDKALGHYNLSLREQTGNRHQATLTYLRMADLYLAQSEFEKARNYYDSTATALPMDFRDAAQVRRKIINMDRLITNKQVVARQDSLQALARLDPQSRESAIDSIISHQYQQLLAQEEAAVREAEDRAKSSRRQTGSQQAVISPFDQDMQAASASAYTDNRFYFNNPDAVGMGMSAFRRRWGNRSLQDNWRISESQQSLQTTPSGTATGGVSPSNNPGGVSPSGNPGDPTAAGGQGGQGAPGDGIRPGDAGTQYQVDLQDSTAFAEWIRQDLLTHMPLDPESLLSSQTMIKTALAENGEIYRFNLREFGESIKTYTSLLQRFPEDEQAAAWYFNLYQLHQATGDRKASEYRDKILGTYPQSIFSKIILDPDYLQELEAEKQRANELYARLYTQYVNREFQEIIRQVGEPAGNAQVAYLKALAIGRTSSVDDFAQSLSRIAAQFPADSLVTPLALQHLRYMDQHPAEFEDREFALTGRDGDKNRFLDEPGLTPWPQLVMHSSRPAAPVTVAGSASQSGLSVTRLPGDGNAAAISPPQLAGNTTLRVDNRQNTYRDLSLLPDTATYFFVIHVMHPTVNLAPSRFGIGQFNRSRYADAAISHQLQRINDESQLIYIGPFTTFNEAKIYEARFLPLIGEMMKIPAEVYQTFIVTEAVFGTLSDFGKIDDYYHFYISQ